MYEISKDYLSRLLEQSGVKLGGAKASAMTALIELLDENTLNGLLASIKKDYTSMQEAVKALEAIRQEVQAYQARLTQLRSSEHSLRTQIDGLYASIDKLKSEESTARFENELRGCREEERSRVLAYEAAIRIGKAAYSDHVPNDAMPQILRSASNVAAGAMTTGERTVANASERMQTLSDAPARKRSVL